MKVIPELPDTYTSDPHLKSFLKLLIEGLSDDRSLRPSIDCYQKHQFLQVEPDIDAATDDDWEREYLEIVESIVCKNDFRRERVKHQVLAKRGYLIPHQ
jgi:gamma-glutamyl phosphate reductase